MGILIACTALVSSFLISYFLCARLSLLLTKKSVLAIPNPRSNHKMPTPVGGGVAVIISFFVGCVPLILLYSYQIKQPLFLGSALALLCAISFRDDMKHVPAGLRLIAHFISAIIGAFVVQHNGSIFHNLLDKDFEYLVIVLLIVFFTNLFNFMDGIDGMSGVEAIHLSIGIAIALYVLNNQSSYIYVSLLIGACSAGFLIHNWHPAKIFLGDAGSVTLGYIFSMLLLVVAAKGAWAAAIILPLYYLCDAGFILAKRAISLERIWEAHTTHFFQRAVRSGISHAEVALKVFILNLALLALSIMSLYVRGEILKELSILILAILVTITAIRLLSVKMPCIDIKAKRQA